MIPLCTHFLKPWSSTDTVYVPGMRNGAAKLPLASLTTDTDVPLSRSSMLTCAPGIGWPAGSVTVPTMLPVVTCASISTGHETDARTTSTSAVAARLTATKLMAASLGVAPRTKSHGGRPNLGTRTAPAEVLPGVGGTPDIGCWPDAGSEAQRALAHVRRQRYDR